MNLNDYKKMDHNILIGVINARLRVRNKDLDDFCKENDIDQEDLIQHMKSVGFEYVQNINQFKEH